jgi:hypothetical protein
MIFSICLALLLVLITFYIHLLTLRYLGVKIPQSNISSYNQVLLIVIALFIAHLVEVSIYALTYEISIKYLKMGTLHGDNVNIYMEYLYYSLVTYTSLGIGDIYPEGHIRFITGIEALNGLMLITWSASFTFIVMKKLWPWQDGCKQNPS